MAGNVCRCGTYVAFVQPSRMPPGISSEEIDDAIADESRRAFRACPPVDVTSHAPFTARVLQATGVAGAGLMLAYRAAAGRPASRWRRTTASSVYPPTAFIRIGADDSVTPYQQARVRQGVMTSLPMLSGELDCDWNKVSAEHAPAAQSTPTRHSASR